MTQTSVRRKRLDKGWTLDQLSQKCAAKGVPTSISNLHRIEVGEQIPRPGLRKVLAELLGMDIDDLEQVGAGVN